MLRVIALVTACLLPTICHAASLPPEGNQQQSVATGRALAATKPDFKSPVTVHTSVFALPSEGSFLKFENELSFPLEKQMEVFRTQEALKPISFELKPSAYRAQSAFAQYQPRRGNERIFKISTPSTFLLGLSSILALALFHSGRVNRLPLYRYQRDWPMRISHTHHAS